MSDPKFWSDDFDMDLPKVIPGAKHLLGECADMELVTHGSTTHGRLNHPAVWNHSMGVVAYFGRLSPHKPPRYSTNHPVVRCTLFEAIRDAWVHDIVIVFEGSPIWDGSKTRAEFDPLMYQLRKWRSLPDWRIEKHKEAVRMRLELVPYFVGRAIETRTPA